MPLQSQTRPQQALTTLAHKVPPQQLPALTMRSSDSAAAAAAPGIACSDPDQPRKAKRVRRNYTLQTKVEAARVVKAYKGILDLGTMSNALNINRWTLSRICSDQNRLRQFAQHPQDPELSNRHNRIQQSNTAIRGDELLIQWYIHLYNQFIPGTLDWLRWQAFPIYRMILAFGGDDSYRYLTHSKGWLQSFMKGNLKKGIAIPQAWTKSDLVRLLQDKQDSALQNALQRLRTILNDTYKDRDDDVYFLDETSTFAAPPCRSSHPNQPCPPPGGRGDGLKHKNGAGISIVLFCNANGKDMREPVMLNRLIQTPSGWRPNAFTAWLRDFNDELDRANRNVLLLVGASVWQQIQHMLTNLMLPRVHIEAVPAQLNAWMPMRTGIVLEFKLNVMTINFEETFSHHPLSHEGAVYRKAWQTVDASIVQRCFCLFKHAIPGLSPKKKNPSGGEETNADDGESSPAWRRLYGFYQNAELSAEIRKHIDSVLGYYKNQDIEIGPSTFLCEYLMTSRVWGPYDQCFLEEAGIFTRDIDQWWNTVLISEW
ncbi:hypothetical protein BGW42_001129 [Actinomortierella wolfii]|nr:hypothetical protein BGW42_001129 [Actinomortierella wolfii]